MAQFPRAQGLIGDFLTVSEFAERWGVTRQRVHQWAEDGRVAAFMAFGRVVLLASAQRPEPAKRGDLHRLAFDGAKRKREVAVRQRQKRRWEKGRRLALYEAGGVDRAILRGMTLDDKS